MMVKLNTMKIGVVTRIEASNDNMEYENEDTLKSLHGSTPAHEVDVVRIFFFSPFFNAS